MQAVACLNAAKILQTYQLSAATQGGDTLAAGFDSVANAAGVAVVVTIGTGLLITRQLEHTL